jgi:hypothetical protein
MSDLMLVDWENWGLAPRGHDAARLIVYSGLCPSTQKRLFSLFHTDLITPSGQISLLFAVAMLKHEICAGIADPSLDAPSDLIVARVADLANSRSLRT